MNSFTELVHNLPAELFDEIQELTFTPDEDEIVISKGFKPPVQLQISRGTRKRYAEKFYSTTSFIFPEHKYCSLELLEWLRTLRDVDLNFIKNVKYRPKRALWKSNDEDMLKAEEDLDYFKGCTGGRVFQVLPANVVFIGVWAQEENGPEKEVWLTSAEVEKIVDDFGY